MSQPSTQATQTALLFTDTQGKVIYVDHSFLRLMNYSEAGLVTGEPLFKALKLDQQIAKNWLTEMQKTGILVERPMIIPGVSGPTVRISVTGIATYDDMGKYIGADVTLRKVVQEESPVIETTPIVELNAGSVKQTHIETPEEHMFVELYFTTHIKGFYVLLSRLVGLWIQKNVDKVINESAEKHGFAVRIKNGLFLTDLTHVEYTGYRMLLSEVVNYALSLIGQQTVNREIQQADTQMHPGVLAYAERAGLKNFHKQKV